IPPPVSVPRARELEEADIAADTHTADYFRAALRFFRAYLTVAALLRFASLEFNVERVRARRNAHHRERPNSYITQVARHYRSFSHCRNLLYSATGRCLFDCFVLTEYLAQYGIFPSIIFGVRALPFNAHCWVQTECYVINDDAERVNAYTPI